MPFCTSFRPLPWCLAGKGAFLPGQGNGHSLRHSFLLEVGDAGFRPTAATDAWPSEIIRKTSTTVVEQE